LSDKAGRNARVVSLHTSAKKQDKSSGENIVNRIKTYLRRNRVLAMTWGCAAVITIPLIASSMPPFRVSAFIKGILFIWLAMFLFEQALHGLDKR
jgi:hypothetical protein